MIQKAIANGHVPRVLCMPIEINGNGLLRCRLSGILAFCLGLEHHHHKSARTPDRYISKSTCRIDNALRLNPWLLTLAPESCSACIRQQIIESLILCVRLLGIVLSRLPCTHYMGGNGIIRKNKEKGALFSCTKHEFHCAFVLGLVQLAR